MDQDQSKEPQYPHAPPIPRDPEDRTPSKIIPTCDCFVEKGMAFDRQQGLYMCSKCGSYEDHSDRTAHQQRIDEFMNLAGQEIKDTPFLPSQEVRAFRARIIFEETIETVEALGFVIMCKLPGETRSTRVAVDFVDFHPHTKGPNLVEIADGCGDISVVTIGTLTACGISDKPVLEAVDENNLSKFKPRCPNCNEVMHILLQNPHKPEQLTGTAGVDANHKGWSCWACESQFPKEVGGYRREDGKYVKGSAHRKVDLRKVLIKQGAVGL